MQLDFNNISKEDISTLLTYDSVKGEEEKEELGLTVISILQNWIQTPALGGLKVNLVHELEPSFLAYDKASLKRVKEIDDDKEPLTQKLKEKLDKEFPTENFYKLIYKYSAAQYDHSIGISYIVPLIELIDTVIHENIHLYFKEQPSHLLYNHDDFEYGKIIEERAVEYATFKVLENLEKIHDIEYKLRGKIKHYRQTFLETAKFEERFYTRLLDETTYDEETSDIEEIDKIEIRKKIATQFYKNTKKIRYEVLYKNFHEQIKENETDRILAYILQRAPYVVDSDILDGIKSEWENMTEWKDYAYRTGNLLLHQIAENKSLTVPNLPN